MTGTVAVSQLIDIRSAGCPSPNHAQRQSAVDAGEFKSAAPQRNNIPLLVGLAVCRPLIDESAARFRGPGDVEELPARAIGQRDDIAAHVVRIEISNARPVQGCPQHSLRVTSLMAAVAVAEANNIFN